MSKINTKQTQEPEHPDGELFQPEFTAVGIGASAGGLDALKTFFKNTPPDTGMAYVVVMHLSPEHRSHLPELLQSHTKMPVIQVTETMKMAPDHIYVIPPNRNLSAIDTHLRLSELEEARQQRAPIDHFFRTLASTHGEKAIGIVLSGTGSDGSLGLKQIKESGGLTVVQDPLEAQYDSMPQNAIATGLIDLVVPVAQMAAQIRDFLRVQPRLPDDGSLEELPETEEELVRKIFAQLRAHAGHDFSGYKRATVMRRLRRRMQIRRVEDLPAYLQLLRQSQEEAHHLFRDLLITVTNFFRDPEAFAALEAQVIPRLFAGKDRGDAVRVWVAGCATGEEAYSLAMLLLEERGRLDDAPQIQVFASDIAGEALVQAREGIYPGVANADVSPERLERFFHKENGGYRVKKEVREVILFADHDLLNDPPFSRLDLISCRNLLIYLQRDVQNKIIQLFHYSLRPEGFLFLGTSETLASADLFRTIDKKHGLYQRQAVAWAHVDLPSLPLTPRPLPIAKARGAWKVEGRAEGDGFGVLHQEMVERYAPPSLVVDEDFNIVHLSQHAGRYLHQPGGEPTNGVLQRIRPALRAELTTALYGAFEKDRPSCTRPVRILLEGEMRRVSMSAHPAVAQEMAGYVLVIFMETADLPEGATGDEGGQESSAVVRALEEELARTKERLQTVVEGFESSGEEMRASNEELQSMNEELRSTAEELETSKEELQSINEELLAVNQENKNKVEELNNLTSDLQNLLASTDLATLFLDRELRIRRFTPRVSELFNIMPADRGRPLAHITHKLQDGDLLEDAGRVLQQLSPVERQMISESGRWYLARLRPYRSVDDRIDGVVITFVDISPLKRVQEELRVAKEFREYIVHTVREGLLVLNLDLTVAFANLSFLNMFQVTEEETVGRLVYELGNGQWDIPELHQLLEDILPDNMVFNDYEVTHTFKSIGERIMLLNGRRLDGQQLILLAIEDTTERHRALADLKRLNATLEKQVAQRTRKIRDLASELLVAEQKVRRHIAQVLHDDLQQILYSARMHLQMTAQDLTSEGTEVLGADLAQLDDMINNAFVLSRKMAMELTPPVPMGGDFREALRELAGHVEGLHGLKVKVMVEDSVGLEEGEMRLLLLYIVRELLFNIVKHAGVKEAGIKVAQQNGYLRVTVSDKGRGFDADPLLKRSAGAGFGLFSIQERLQLLDGRLEINSMPGDGTRVSIIVPLEEHWQILKGMEEG